MNPKLLTESGWKANVQKFKIKDNGLLRALATYEKTQDDEHDELIKTIASMNQLAANLKKAKEVAAEAAAVKYLNDLIDALESEQREIAKDKALAEKTEAMTQKKADAEAKKRDKEEEEEDEDEEEEEEEEEEEGEGAYAVRLVSAFQKLKSAKDLSFDFIVCDAKPHCGLMVAKRITPKHKQELTTVTGGSKRFLHLGTCRFEDGRFVFNMEKPVTGLARKIQDSLKHFTGKKLPIKVGTESAEDDEGESDAPESKERARPQTIAPPKLGKAMLSKAPEVWHQTRHIMTTNIGQLKSAIQDEYAEESPELIAEIDQNLKKLDSLLSTLDHKLADSLAKAHAEEDAAARAAELKNAKTILTNYIKYVKSEPLIAHIDANPFGVDTNLKKVLLESLTHMAQAIG